MRIVTKKRGLFELSYHPARLVSYSTHSKNKMHNYIPFHRYRDSLRRKTYDTVYEELKLKRQLNNTYILNRISTKYNYLSLNGIEMSDLRFTDFCI